MVARELEAEDKVTVIDSANLSTGVGLMVIEAAIMASEGKSSSDIKAVIEILKPKVRASFVVDTLTYLYRGGRCSATAAMAGSVLKLHPKIVVENGAMDATKKYRGKLAAVIMSYVKDMEDELKNARNDRVFITHSGCDREIVEGVNILGSWEYLMRYLRREREAWCQATAVPERSGYFLFQNRNV